MSFSYIDKLFASGSLDGTILLWSSETFIPVKKLNTMADYKGKANIYPYSVQYIACENQVLKHYQHMHKQQNFAQSMKSHAPFKAEMILK